MKVFVKYILTLVSVLVVSCSTYTTKKVINETSSIENSKKIGVLLRTSVKSRINSNEILKNLSYSLNGYKKKAEIIILPEINNSLTEYSEDSDRFYQRDYDDSGRNGFLKYKSIGSIKSYLMANKEEIKRIMVEQECEGLMLYEVNCLVSVEMQFMTFDSVLVAIDKELNIAYLDYQYDDFDSTEFDFPSIKNQIMNKVSDRFLLKLLDMDFIDKI